MEEVYEKRKLSVKLLLIIMAILYFFGIWQLVLGVIKMGIFELFIIWILTLISIIVLFPIIYIYYWYMYGN